MKKKYTFKQIFFSILVWYAPLLNAQYIWSPYSKLEQIKSHLYIILIIFHLEAASLNSVCYIQINDNPDPDDNKIVLSLTL